ncbi:hypothetical protein HO133_009879 [Letharia lupina]|uniref:Uncharacterized protein n=1 Tax=Letharia lupina TaxID=560253 RepID=A0A8H6FET9_9LECA|nr:uncharacterized protein HO133_009879 [Letharia lupina]KAF6225877.1 hypothetical protein HO133_009879 [Letharia lupina]
MGPETLDVVLACTDHKVLVEIRRTPQPCSDVPGTPGAVSWGSIILHELVHLDASDTLGVEVADLLTEYTARAVLAVLPQGTNATSETNAYEQMAGFAWALGLGAPWWQGGTGLHDFSNSNFDGMW